MGASGCFFFFLPVSVETQTGGRRRLVSSETRYLRKTQARKSCPGQVSDFISRPLVLPPQI